MARLDIITQEPVIRLELSKEEAAWLRAQLQNPLHGQLDESKEDTKHRSALWKALDVPEVKFVSDFHTLEDCLAKARTQGLSNG